MILLKLLAFLSLGLLCRGTIDKELLEIIARMEQDEEEEDESTLDEDTDALMRWISGFKNFDPEEFLTFAIEPADDVVSILFAWFTDSQSL